MKIYIVGIGMEGDKTLTPQGLAAIKAADILIGAERMLTPFLHLSKNTLCSWRTEEITDYLKKNKPQTAAVLMSGDCGFYSGAEKLTAALDGFDTEVISGISSPVYFCAKIKKSWQNMKCISLHGMEGNLIRHVCRNASCFFLLGGSITPAAVCRRLCRYGMGSIRVYIGERLAYEDEQIYSGRAEDFTELQCGGLSVMVTENPDPEPGTAFGISDARFIRGKVPMTKSEVRSTVISKLNIGRKDICWDIGCGTGSVSVEMALQCYDGHVFALDQNEEAVQLTKENSIRFGCDNIETISGTAPECLNELPAPDRIFIGGSSGRLPEILTVVFEKNPAACVVITAVSLETLGDAVSALEQYSHHTPDIVQLSVTRTRKAGNHTMLSAENPVFIIKGVGN
ncbi:MAG: precorrin-6y C5,15-methyltransferase (decarboxylating) subunit CbiE [Ruminococcus sp.]|nr:precorrin-6y C5,15-methyltransferase (decarboxylating) subunit CbiE [Ruminococcus sp.]